MGRDVTNTPSKDLTSLSDLTQHTHEWANDQERSPLSTCLCAVPAHMPCHVPIEPTYTMCHMFRLHT
jgi:hypothetical protein